MKLNNALPYLLVAGTVAGCVNLDLTNPNQPSTDTYWETQADAVSGVNAVYNGLLNNGTYGRWLVFAMDLRSDIGMIQSPWTDLSNFTKFTFTSYDFEVNASIWQDTYQTIFRANQVIDRVPAIAMDAALRDRLVGEAKFIRALLYFNLVNLYGSPPLITKTPAPADRPGNATPAQIYAQIEQDLTDAQAVLPVSYSGADVGRATRGAATALLGKAYLQQRNWNQASQEFAKVIGSGVYDLVPNYEDNFTALDENNEESIFEVQFGDRSLLASGVRGLNIARMVGPCGPSYCDGRPTRWYLEQFRQDTALDGTPDPRLLATLYFAGGTPVYQMSWQDRYGTDTTTVFWKKWGEYYLGTDQDWDAAINFRVMRFADVLLAQAEALNELGQPDSALPLVNRVRARVNMPPIPAGLDQATMRDRILRERMFELGLEGQRWLDLARHDLIGTALVAHDAEFQYFVPGKTELLPIPQSEIDLNPNLHQNPGW
jgi:starch-binding outer membrane protein, SusD/RagB family